MATMDQHIASFMPIPAPEPTDCEWISQLNLKKFEPMGSAAKKRMKHVFEKEEDDLLHCLRRAGGWNVPDLKTDLLDGFKEKMSLERFDDATFLRILGALVSKSEFRQEYNISRDLARYIKFLSNLRLDARYGRILRDANWREFKGSRFLLSDDSNSETGPLKAEALTGQDLVDYINTDQNLWKARLNDKFTLSGKVKDDLLGHSPRDLGRIAQNLADRGNISLPLSFDAREKWPYCQSIWRIDDQSSCGSCWATGGVMSMSDRICIASGGEIQVSLSVMDLVACCTNCSENFSKEKGGCFGGNIVPGWQFWNSDGLVTGSDYTKQMGCRPYPFPHCERGVNSSHYPQCKEFNESYPTPSCETTCQDNYKENSYNSDKHYGHPPFVIANDSEAIQKELYTNGPLEVCFDVYEDFEHYTSGIYKHVGGKYRFRHCVRLIGWGEENGTLFWILANTFNSDWGDHGFFRIVRGSNECNIEVAAVGALPDLNRYQASEAGSCRRWITVLAVLTVLTHSLALCLQRYKI